MECKKISPTRFELVTLRLSNYSLTLFQLSYGEFGGTVPPCSMGGNSKSNKTRSSITWSLLDRSDYDMTVAAANPMPVEGRDRPEGRYSIPPSLGLHPSSIPLIAKKFNV